METMPVNQWTADYTLHDSAQSIIPSLWSAGIQLPQSWKQRAILFLFEMTDRL